MSLPKLPLARTGGTTLADALQQEIRRVRDVVIPAYESIGDAGKVALLMMREDLDLSVKALAEQDGVECVRRFESLKGWKL